MNLTSKTKNTKFLEKLTFLSRLKIIKGLFLTKLDQILKKLNRNYSGITKVDKNSTALLQNNSVLLEASIDIIEALQDIRQETIENKKNQEFYQHQLDKKDKLIRELLVTIENNKNELKEEFLTPIQNNKNELKEESLEAIQNNKNELRGELLEVIQNNKNESNQQNRLNRRILEASHNIQAEEIMMFSNDKNYQENKKAIQENDIFLSSYPRSGNTWIRLLLSDIMLQAQGHTTDTGGNIIPDMYKDNIDSWYLDERIKQLPIRIIKTHEPYEKEYKKIIYIFRNPADALCSYFHYQNNSIGSKNRTIDIETFCRIHVSEWCWHIGTYIKAKERKRDKIQFISYESLKKNTAKSLQTIANFCGLFVEKDLYQKAVDHQDFEKLQSLTRSGDDSKLGFKVDDSYYGFFRLGQTNTSIQELSDETIQFIEEKSMNLYKQAQSLEDFD